MLSVFSYISVISICSRNLLLDKCKWGRVRCQQVCRHSKWTKSWIDEVLIHDGFWVFLLFILSLSVCLTLTTRAECYCNEGRGVCACDLKVATLPCDHLQTCHIDCYSLSQIKAITWHNPYLSFLTIRDKWDNKYEHSLNSRRGLLNTDLKSYLRVK